MSRKKLFCFTVLTLAFLLPDTGFAQQFGSGGNSRKVPVYRSAQDSTDYAEMMLVFRKELDQKKPDQAKLNKLGRQIDSLRDVVITGQRTIYFPNKTFTSAKSLSDTTKFTNVVAISMTGADKFGKHVWKCSNVTAIEMVNTSIRRIPAKLRKLKNLKTIEIYNNQTRSAVKLPRSRSAYAFTMNGCDPKTIPHSFRRFPNLGFLDLSENNLTKFPQGITKNRKLKELTLQHNNLTLEEPLRGHPALERLSLQHNRISRVPGSIATYRKLVRLSFNYNLIDSVDPGIEKLDELSYLSFYANQLPAIPGPVYKIKSLQAIDLFHNQIDQLDSTLSGWSHLEWLYLSHNKIVFLPENLNRLKSLRGLYVDYNRIDRLPETVGGLDSLQILKVNHNFLKAIPLAVLSLGNLEELDISNNYLTDISPRLFDFRRYRIFSLANNPWSADTKKFLPQKVSELRSKNVFVHVMGEQDNQ
jgi:Leucine-rich repeat (LRR) protein